MKTIHLIVSVFIVAPVSIADFNTVNLVWVNKTEATSDYVAPDTALNNACGWAALNPKTDVNIWYDKAFLLRPRKTLTRSNNYIKEKCPDYAGRIFLKDIRSLDFVTKYAAFYQKSIPIFTRVDMFRLQLLADLATSSPLSKHIYSDIDIRPLSNDNLNHKLLSNALSNFGIVFSYKVDVSTQYKNIYEAQELTDENFKSFFASFTEKNAVYVYNQNNDHLYQRYYGQFLDSISSPYLLRVERENSFIALYEKGRAKHFINKYAQILMRRWLLLHKLETAVYREMVSRVGGQLLNSSPEFKDNIDGTTLRKNYLAKTKQVRRNLAVKHDELDKLVDTKRKPTEDENIFVNLALSGFSEEIYSLLTAVTGWVLSEKFGCKVKESELFNRITDSTYNKSQHKAYVAALEGNLETKFGDEVENLVSISACKRDFEGTNRHSPVFPVFSPDVELQYIERSILYKPVSKSH